MRGGLHRLLSVLTLLDAGDDRLVDILEGLGRQMRMHPEALARAVAEGVAIGWIEHVETEGGEEAIRLTEEGRRQCEQLNGPRWVVLQRRY